MRVAIAGAGAVGRSIATELLENGHEVLLIDHDPKAIAVESVPRAEWLLADACEISSLDDAALHRCNVVIAATGAVVHYQIADAARFLFAVRDGDALVRMVAEGSLRALAASYPLDTMLTVDRHVLEDRWAAAMRARLATIDVGVDVLGIFLADVHPPVEVVDAFRDVASAEEERVMRINEADAYSKEEIPIARGNAAASLEAAAGYKATRVAQSEGDASRFLARVAQTLANPMTMWRLQMEALEQVLPGKRLIITDGRSGGRRSLVFLGNGDLLNVLGTSTTQGLYNSTPPANAPPAGADDEDK